VTLTAGQIDADASGQGAGGAPATGFAPAGGEVARRPALDGLRAIAVAAVVVYHADDRLLPGGFVGVDVFFVLSGYLITALLLHEHARSGGVSLRGFWRRRVRRLWPLAWVVLGAVALIGLTGVWGEDQQRTLGAQTLAALANVANWWQSAHGGYLEAGSAPSPLRHFWSLAVEEQFYLFWPLLLIGLLAVAGRVGSGTRRGAMVMWAGLLALFAASAVSAFFTDPLTAYLATHTRAVALFAGAGLAFAFRARPLSGPTGHRARGVVSVWAGVGTGVLVWVALTATPEDPWLHRGGFSVVAVAAAGVVALAVAPGSVRRWLGWSALVWVGRRSYAIYLVHWPIIVALGPGRATWVVLAVVIPASVLLADLAHRGVESPVLAGRWSPRVLGSAGLVVLVVTAAALVGSRPTAETPTEQVAASLERVADPSVPPAIVATPDAAPGTGDDPTAVDPDDAPPSTAPPTTVPCVPTTAPVPEFGGGTRQFDYATVGEVVDPGAACAGQVRVLVLGDSLGRGASNGLVSLADPRIQVWDRTTLGCSFGPDSCEDWREPWSVNVLGVQPDVVLVFSRVVGELAGVRDEPRFLSPEGRATRVAEFSAAVERLSAGGARVVFVNAAVPGRPNGLFYCKGRARSSGCDPEWVTEWNASLADAAAAAGAAIVDAGGWVAARSATDRDDRPDGLHLSGPALREFSTWLLPQVLTTVGRG
jgi:peptidoglycan/LPS O-acetylase OafA/YrhL